MNQDKVIRIAKKAGGAVLKFDTEPKFCCSFTQENLERFAQLVAAAEREKCAEVCDKEAAFYGECGWVQAASNCAAAIRALEN